MNIENRIAVARIAADLTIAVLSGKDHHLKNLRDEGKIPLKASPMAAFVRCMLIY